MSERLPEILSVKAAEDGDHYSRPQRVGGYVDVSIVLRGIRNEPVEDHRLTSLQAVKLAEELLHAVRIAGWE